MAASSPDHCLYLRRGKRPTRSLTALYRPKIRWLLPAVVVDPIRFTVMTIIDRHHFISLEVA